MTLIMCKGLPGSGKTTWAKAQKAKRINKDDLRNMLDNGEWSKKNESQILIIRDVMIENLFHTGVDIIIDDTNLAPKHEERLRNLATKYYTPFVIQDFTDVSLENCIKRDLNRENSVGEKVIRDMYNKYLRKQVVAPELDSTLPFCLICDIDGTLAKMGDRGPFEWDKVGMDIVKLPIAEILTRFGESRHPWQLGVKRILLSGRDGSCRPQTEQWLYDNEIKHEALFMREPNDNRKDSIVKREIYDREIRGKYNVLFVLDDRNQVVDMWRNELGLTCLQVAEGDF